MEQIDCSILDGGCMKGPLLTGPARDLVLDYLKANLNTMLQDSDIKRADGLSLGQVQSKSFYISEAYEALDLPACYVLFDRFTFKYDTEPNYIEGEHDMTVIIPAESLEAKDLQQKVESYARVLFNLLDQQSLVDSANRFQLKLVSKSIEYGDLIWRKEPSDRKKFRRDCIYKWKAIHFENRLIP